MNGDWTATDIDVRLARGGSLDGPVLAFWSCRIGPLWINSGLVLPDPKRGREGIIVDWPKQRSGYAWWAIENQELAADVRQKVEAAYWAKMSAGDLGETAKEETMSTPQKQIDVNQVWCCPLPNTRYGGAWRVKKVNEDLGQVTLSHLVEGRKVTLSRAFVLKFMHDTGILSQEVRKRGIVSRVLKKLNSSLGVDNVW